MYLNKFFTEIIEESRDWCRGKIWYVRLPLLIWFAYLLLKYWSSPMYYGLLGGVNLGIHEFGHLLFSFFGTFLSILGGTLIQLLIPIALMINFYRQPDFFALALCFGWLSSNLFDVARYVNDARAMELPLVSVMGNENPIHDWNYLLSRLSLLQFDTFLSFLLKIIATFSMFICLGFGAWLLWQMKLCKQK